MIKSTVDDVGKILSGEIIEVALLEEGIRIYVEVDGKTYRNNMGFIKRVGDTYFIDPLKKVKQLVKFEDKFGVPADQGETLVGRSVMFEIKRLGYTNTTYIDIKQFPK